MYLMDEIVQCDARLAATGKPVPPSLRAYAEMAERLKLAPRYLLDSKSAHASCELTFGRPKIMLDSLATLKLRYPVLWCEWEEAGRQVLRDKLGDAYEGIPGRRSPTRCGFLLDVEEGGRRGLVTWCWSEPSGNFPNISPIGCYFDLDNRFKQGATLVDALKRSRLIDPWISNPVQEAAFLEIWETSEHRPTPAGMEFLYAVSSTRHSIASALENFYCDVYGEYINFWAVMLLLTAARPVVEYISVDRSKINKARIKKRQAPLLDHHAVTMHLVKHSKRELERGPLDFTRKSPHIHLVSRYLNHRNDKHWIVEPFVRGSGEPVPKHIHVRG